MKELRAVTGQAEAHWVGDGFHVRSLFSYHEGGAGRSPFLLLDYGRPAPFPPGGRRRGVGEHPHRGFETVTIAYQGEIEHRDSSGGGGRIGPGDVQWMTAARGIVHEEMHSREFTRQGGTLEMAQLWVNLPAKHKMSAPGYQEIASGKIPSVAIGGTERGMLRVIAGEYAGTRGPARTFTPVDVWDLRLPAGVEVELPLGPGRTTLLAVLRGQVAMNGGEAVEEEHVAIFARDGRGVRVAARQDATVLVLAGEPIDEPIAGYGPFVMNTEDEIRQAVEDYQSGRMGHLRG